MFTVINTASVLYRLYPVTFNYDQYNTLHNSHGNNYLYNSIIDIFVVMSSIMVLKLCKKKKQQILQHL